MLLTLYALMNLIWKQISKGAAHTSSIGIILISFFALNNEAIKGKDFVEYVFAGAGLFAFGAMAINWLRSRWEKKHNRERERMTESYNRSTNEQSANNYPQDYCNQYYQTHSALDNRYMWKRHLAGAILNLFLACAFAMVAAGAQLAPSYPDTAWKLNNPLSILTLISALLSLHHVNLNLHKKWHYAHLERMRKMEMNSCPQS